MATLTIKNIPDTLYQDLKEQALSNHRSLNKEVIVSLERSVHKSHNYSRAILLNARALRIRENSTIQLTNPVINKAKQQGRL
jgi:plasmid stability protein